MRKDGGGDRRGEGSKGKKVGMRDRCVRKERWKGKEMKKK